MTTKKEVVDITKGHPMEEILDLEEGTTMFPTVQRSTELSTVPQYDEKDNEIEHNFQEVYDLALQAYETQAEEAELVEGKFKARNGEIAAQYLNTALNAAKEKSLLKQHKDKLTLNERKVTNPNGMTQNNLIVGDRNDILKTIFQNKNQTIEQDTNTDE